MKKILTVVFVVMLLISCAVWGNDGLRLSFYPDGRAPSISIEGTHTWGLTFADLSLQWEVGMWTYISPPPTGYGSVFYTFQAHPQAAFSLFSGWEFRIGGIVEYRTNLPDRVVFVPQLSIWHAW